MVSITCISLINEFPMIIDYMGKGFICLYMYILKSILCWMGPYMKLTLSMYPVRNFKCTKENYPTMVKQYILFT